MADDRRARRRGGALWFEPRRLVCARIRTRDARDDAPSAITQSIVRSIARSIHQQKVNTQNGLPSDAPPTPTPTTRLAGRVRIIRASSSRACLFALERRRHHACIHPRASSCIIIPSITTSTQRATPTTRLSSTGRVRRHRTSDVTCTQKRFFADRRVRVVPGRVGLSFPASHRDWTGQRRRRRRRRDRRRDRRARRGGGGWC